MDGLELKATGGGQQNIPKDTFEPDKEPNSTTAMGDTFQRADGIGNPVGPAPRQTAQKSPLETPAPTADLEATRKSMQADYTRKTQEIADMRRNLEQRQSELDRQMGRVQEIMLSGQGNAQQQARDILDVIPRTVRESLNPEAQQVLEALGTLVDERVNTLKEGLQDQPALNEIKQQMAALQHQLWAQQKLGEFETVRQQYGADAVSQYAPRAVAILQQFPHLTAGQAFQLAAPEVVQEQVRQQAIRDYESQRAKQQQGSLSEFGVDPSADPNVAYKIGESMKDSARIAFAQERAKGRG